MERYLGILTHHNQPARVRASAFDAASLYHRQFMAGCRTRRMPRSGLTALGDFPGSPSRCGRSRQSRYGRAYRGISNRTSSRTSFPRSRFHAISRPAFSPSRGVAAIVIVTTRMLYRRHPLYRLRCASDPPASRQNARTVTRTMGAPPSPTHSRIFQPH